MELEVLASGELPVERRVLEDQADPRRGPRSGRGDVDAGDLATPEVGRISVHRMLIVVDFPAPFGPRKPKISPAPTSRSMPRTASTFP